MTLLINDIIRSIKCIENIGYLHEQTYYQLQKGFRATFGRTSNRGYFVQ